MVNQIKEGRTSIGIEFGSTRIKAVLIGDDFTVAASGAYDWENSFIDGVWTYSLNEVRDGLQGAFASLAEDVKRKYGVALENVA